MQFGRLIFAFLGLLFSIDAVAESATTDCLSAPVYAEQLTDALQSQHLDQVRKTKAALSGRCGNASPVEVQVLIDAATLFKFLHTRNNVELAQQSFNRLLLHEFSQLTAQQQAAFYHLMALYSLYTGNYKQALSITHIITSELLPSLQAANKDTAPLSLAIADIHFEIEFFQSVRALLLPLLEHPDLQVRLRAAAMLWHIPQTQQQLDTASAVLNENARELPDTLIKLSALEVILHEALESNDQAMIQTALHNAYQLAYALQANAALIRLYLLEAKTNNSTQAIETLLAYSPRQLSLKEQLPVLKLDIDRAIAAQSWQQAVDKLQQAVALDSEIANNNALAREYASFQLVTQARELEQARQQSHLQTLAAEQQKQQRLIILLALVSAVLAIAVLSLLFFKKRKAADHFEKLANTDGLTQVLNRRAIQHFAEQVAARSKQLKQPFVVALADIDHFKSINDTYGHDVGDIVLTEFARRTNALTRQQDRLGRWGGEEWLIVMTDTQLDAITGLFKRMQEDIHSIDTGEHQLTVTFSMGAVVGDGEQSVEALIQAADELLYKAKHGGRNQLCKASD